MTNSNQQYIVTVYTDGSYCNKTKAGGWGIWLRWHNGSKEFSGGLKDIKNSQLTELEAVLQGIYKAYQLLKHFDRLDNAMIVVVTDCDTIIQKFADRTKWVDDYARIKDCKDFLGSVKVKLNKVKAHSTGNIRRHLNNKVDALAYTEMRIMRYKAGKRSSLAPYI